jgi:hypothetical protein
MKSFFAQCKVALPVPCYTQICRRCQHLEVNIKTGRQKAITDIVVDATGLKVYGEGEWKVRMHGWGKHRTWMKLAVAVDSESQQALAIALTTNAVDDAATVKDLLDQLKGKINSFTGDGAYDKDKTRKALHQRALKQKEDILQLIPPHCNAVADGKGRAYRCQRDDDIARIKTLETKEWKLVTHYHQRSKAETFMFRYKLILGDKLQARKSNQQKAEVKAGCKILNIMLHLAKPQSEKVV